MIMMKTLEPMLRTQIAATVFHGPKGAILVPFFFLKIDRAPNV